MRVEEITDAGTELGQQAVEHVAEQVAEVCEHERKRIELNSQARISQLHVEGAELTRLKRTLEERLKLAPPFGSQRIQRWKILYCAFTAVVLIVAGFFFVLLSFDPFRLGWKSVLTCLGLALVLAFLTEFILEAWMHRLFFNVIATTAFAAALMGAAMLRKSAETCSRNKCGPPLQRL